MLSYPCCQNCLQSLNYWLNAIDQHLIPDLSQDIMVFLMLKCKVRKQGRVQKRAHTHTHITYRNRNMGFESLYVHGTLNSYMCRQKERYEKLYFMFCIYYDLMFVYNHHFCLCSGFCFLPRCMHKLLCIHSMIFYVPELVGGKRTFKNQYRLGT